MVDNNSSEQSPDMVERVVFACRQSLQTRMPLHVSRERVDEVARDIGIAACNAALEASHHAELVAENASLKAALQGISDLADKTLGDLDEVLALIGGNA